MMIDISVGFHCILTLSHGIWHGMDRYRTGHRDGSFTPLGNRNLARLEAG